MNELREETPLVRGGQGRTDAEIEAIGNSTLEYLAVIAVMTALWFVVKCIQFGKW